MTTNELLSDNTHTISVKLRTEHDGDSDWQGSYALIEGDARALRFLGELMIARSEAEDCSLALHPYGAGGAQFSEGSDLGLRIHRLPCDHGLR
jgi:hypothetical protein